MKNNNNNFIEQKTFCDIPFRLILEIIGEWYEIIYCAYYSRFSEEYHKNQLYGYFKKDKFRTIFHLFNSWCFCGPVLFMNDECFLTRWINFKKVVSLRIFGDDGNCSIKVLKEKPQNVIFTNPDMIDNIHIPQNTCFELIRWVDDGEHRLGGLNPIYIESHIDGIIDNKTKRKTDCVLYNKRIIYLNTLPTFKKPLVCQLKKIKTLQIRCSNENFNYLENIPNSIEQLYLYYCSFNYRYNFYDKLENKIQNHLKKLKKIHITLAFIGSDDLLVKKIKELFKKLSKIKLVFNFRQYQKLNKNEEYCGYLMIRHPRIPIILQNYE